MQNLPLADDLFLIGHDEYTGKPHINGDLMGTVLAGATLGELLLSGRATCVDGRVAVTDQRMRGESVSDAVLAEVCGKHGDYVVRAWVEHLRDGAHELVAQRLINAQVVRREESRGLTGRRIRFPGVKPMACVRPRIQLTYLIERPSEIDVQTAILAGLVLAAGLDHVIVGRSRAAVRDVIIATVDRLPADMQALVAGVNSAVAALALTIRR